MCSHSSAPELWRCPTRLRTQDTARSHKLLSLPLSSLTLRSRPPQNAAFIAAAPLTLLRPAHAAERYLEQKVAAELGADGQPVAYETVRRLAGEGTGLDLSRNEDISAHSSMQRTGPRRHPFTENDFKRLTRATTRSSIPPSSRAWSTTSTRAPSPR